MTSIFDPAHPHYAVHKAFIEGSFANPTNPPQVESGFPGGPWCPTLNPFWNVGTCYRLKSRMLTRMEIQTIVIEVCDTIYPQDDTSYSEADSVFYGAFARAIEAAHGIAQPAADPDAHLKATVEDLEIYKACAKSAQPVKNKA